jgi:hypothetical protein
VNGANSNEQSLKNRALHRNVKIILETLKIHPTPPQQWKSQHPPTGPRPTASQSSRPSSKKSWTSMPNWSAIWITQVPHPRLSTNTNLTCLSLLTSVAVIGPPSRTGLKAVSRDLGRAERAREEDNDRLHAAEGECVFYRAAAGDFWG